MSAPILLHASALRSTVEKDGYITIPNNNFSQEHKEFLPTWRANETYKPLDFIEHHDPGARAHPELVNLFPVDGEQKLKKITPKFGTEVHNVQLSSLSPDAKDDLALFVAQRGVVVFRDQDFTSKGPEFVKEYVKHFGRLHIHPTTGGIKDHPEFHIVYRTPSDNDTFAQRTSLVHFHSDVTYELQPPGTTFFAVLETPEAGGDTLFANTVEAYERLSPEFRKRLDGLHVLHSAKEQAEGSLKAGGFVKRQPVANVHPLVRIHPVTGKKALYVNPQFSRKIVELKDEESQFLLQFLYDHIAQSHDLQVRAHWEPNSIVLWDNRVTSHSAIFDYSNDYRLAYRITPQAERPIDDIKNLNKPDVNNVL